MFFFRNLNLSNEEIKTKVDHDVILHHDGHDELADGGHHFTARHGRHHQNCP